MTNTDIEKMHTQELIELSIKINAELHARLNGTMFALSNYEETKNTAPIKILLDILRGNP